ncbi:MAG: DUF167 domain-containing protein [Pirellulaceae bacterium]|jgi:hypothetical protein|nr:DUF167 domain-containing protein [Pirellulaceae bacterium]
MELTQHADGVILPVRAQPGARRRAIGGIRAGALRVAVTQVAEKGKANRAVADLLCEALHLKHSQLELVAGAHATDKKFLVRGVSAAELAARIQTLASA